MIRSVHLMWELVRWIPLMRTRLLLWTRLLLLLVKVATCGQVEVRLCGLASQQSRVQLQIILHSYATVVVHVWSRKHALLRVHVPGCSVWHRNTDPLHSHGASGAAWPRGAPIHAAVLLGVRGHVAINVLEPCTYYFAILFHGLKLSFNLFLLFRVIGSHGFAVIARIGYGGPLGVS